MHPLDQILNTWRQEAAQALFSRRRDVGTEFEDLCTAFLHQTLCKRPSLALWSATGSPLPPRTEASELLQS